DRVSRLGADRFAKNRTAGRGCRLTQAGIGHVLDGHDDLEVKWLALAGVDQRHLAVYPAEEAADLVERSLCRREANALDVAAGHMVQAFEGEGEGRPALGSRDRVDLVADYPTDGLQDLFRSRR